MKVVVGLFLVLSAPGKSTGTENWQDISLKAFKIYAAIAQGALMATP